MTDSTRRVLRTAFQIVVALAVAVPVVVGLLPPDMAASTAVIAFAAWTAFVAKVINAFEDRGWIPAWLKDEPVREVDTHRIDGDF